MADGASPKKLSLNEIQRLVGRAVVDDTFRAAFVNDPKGTAGALGIEVDDAAGNLLDTIAGALSDGSSLDDAMAKIREAYLASTDGIIRPRCG